ncbi:hypothetical protein [uncultured Cohaesibacter sp.]|uniref:hypothetical protein n=1 Tax=uncultured Cohaesibacter sp. TaxID=1002546 RepID=UPI0029C70D58|nr:hypothetical protein [uncultured Cohaesibacter sp.]
MFSPVKSIFITLLWFLGAVTLASYLSLQVSAVWGGILFLTLAVFIGIPMSTVSGDRLKRMFLFIFAMLVFFVYQLALVKYDPFASPSRFYGSRCASMDGIVTLRSYLNNHPRESTRYYTCYTDGTAFYWLRNGRETGFAEKIEGTFAPSPQTEFDFFASHYKDPDFVTSHESYVGYFVPQTVQTNPITTQRMATRGLVIFFILAFILDEVWFRYGELQPSGKAHKTSSPANKPFDKPTTRKKNRPSRKRRSKRKSGSSRS